MKLSKVTSYFILILYINFSTPIKLECSYSISCYFILKSCYYCNVNNNPNIISTNTNITIKNSHSSGNNNDNVNGFLAESKIMHYFPNGIEKTFKSIAFIRIHSCELKEIHQSDLKPFSKLTELHLAHNEIEILEQGLFDFNPDLEMTYFDNNKITQISPNIFDHLVKLYWLELRGNKCVNMGVDNNRKEAEKIIQELKTRCLSPDCHEKCLEKIASIKHDIDLLKTSEVKASKRISELSNITLACKCSNDEIAISQNVTLDDFNERIEIIKEQLNFFMYRRNKEIEEITWKIVENQVKTDLKIKSIQKNFVLKSRDCNQINSFSLEGEDESKINILAEKFEKMEKKMSELERKLSSLERKIEKCLTL